MSKFWCFLIGMGVGSWATHGYIRNRAYNGHDPWINSQNWQEHFKEWTNFDDTINRVKQNIKDAPQHK